RYRRPLAQVGVLLALLLVAGAVTIWQALALARAEREQAQRDAREARAQTRRSRDVQDALGQAAALRRQAQTSSSLRTWPEARGVRKRAEALLEGGPADAGLARRVRAMLRELDEEERDLRLVAVLEDVRLGQTELRGNTFDKLNADSRYAEAFRSYGIDVAA